MKTKIKSLIIICALGLVGTLNTSATSSFNTSCVAGMKAVQTENLNSAEFMLNGDADSEFDYQKEAQLVTKWIADNEEAKAMQMLIDKGIFVSSDESAIIDVEAISDNLPSSEFFQDELTESKIDFQNEALLITKMIADREEVKTIQMLIDKGLIVSNDEPVAVADKSEDLQSAENIQKEAQLITKLIADKEEARAIQKLIEEGKLAEIR